MLVSLAPRLKGLAVYINPSTEVLPASTYTTSCKAFGFMYSVWQLAIARRAVTGWGTMEGDRTTEYFRSLGSQLGKCLSGGLVQLCGTQIFEKPKPITWCQNSFNKSDI